MKVFVTGNAGSGKSTLGKALAASLGIEYVTLDKVVWKEGWQKAPEDERRKEISRLISRDDWVIDGVSDEILQAADLVVFLDFPRRVCFYRALKRNSRYLFSSRPGLPPNCPEILIVPKLVKLIWRFPRRVKPRILAEKAARKNNTFVHITSARNSRDFRHIL
jgi:adenylate kinase family enzyme